MPNLSDYLYKIRNTSPELVLLYDSNEGLLHFFDTSGSRSYRSKRQEKRLKLKLEDIIDILSSIKKANLTSSQPVKFDATTWMSAFCFIASDEVRTIAIAHPKAIFSLISMLISWANEFTISQALNNMTSMALTLESVERTEAALAIQIQLLHAKDDLGHHPNVLKVSEPEKIVRKDNEAVGKASEPNAITLAWGNAVKIKRDKEALQRLENRETSTIVKTETSTQNGPSRKILSTSKKPTSIVEDLPKRVSYALDDSADFDPQKYLDRWSGRDNHDDEYTSSAMLGGAHESERSTIVEPDKASDREEFELVHETPHEEDPFCPSEDDEFVNGDYDSTDDDDSQDDESWGDEDCLEDNDWYGASTDTSKTSRMINFQAYQKHTYHQTMFSGYQKPLELVSPLVIIEGFAGSGKTQFIRDQILDFNSEIAGSLEIRPKASWTDDAALVGRVKINPTTGEREYEVTPLLVAFAQTFATYVDFAKRFNYDFSLSDAPYGRQGVHISCSREFLESKALVQWVVLDSVQGTAVDAYLESLLVAMDRTDWMPQENDRFKIACWPVVSAQTIKSLSNKEKFFEDLGLSQTLDEGVLGLRAQIEKSGLCLPFNYVFACIKGKSYGQYDVPLSDEILSRAQTISILDYQEWSVEEFFNARTTAYPLTYPTASEVLLSDFSNCIDEEAKLTLGFLSDLSKTLRRYKLDIPPRTVKNALKLLRAYQPQTHAELHAVWDDIFVQLIYPLMSTNSENINKLQACRTVLSKIEPHPNFWMSERSEINPIYIQYMTR